MRRIASDRSDVDDTDGEAKRGPGRPRKWVDDAERMRAYRQRVAHERAVMKAGGTYVEMAEQITELTRQRDANWAQVLRLQDEIKTLKRERSAPRPSPQRAGFASPDEAAEAAFADTMDARRASPDHADCDAEIDRLETELLDVSRERADLRAMVRRLEEQNASLSSRLIAATSMPPSPPQQPGRPAMSRAQRREAEREAKRRRRRS